MKKRTFLKSILFILPFVFGFCGYYFIEDDPVGDSVFKTISFYVLNSTEAPNLLVDLARWTAPVMTAGGIITLFSSLNIRLHNYLKYISNADPVAVYGMPDAAMPLVRQLGKRGIYGGDKFVRAKRYILLYGEKENLEFIGDHKDKLEGKEIYLQTESMYTDTSSLHIHVFRPIENAVRIYWKQAGLYELARKKNYVLNIVLTGDGAVVSYLLLWGLQYNLFHTKQKITYHVFSDMKEFQHIYHECKMDQDAIYFHDDAWFEHLDILKEADRIIVAEDIETVKKIQFAVAEKDIDYLANESYPMELIGEQGRIHGFFFKNEVYRLQYILNDRLLADAKRLNLLYAMQHSEIEDTPENMETEWQKLNSFTRYSNISAADYQDIRRRMLRDYHCNAYEELSTEELEQLSELEHIRWSRFHYLHNWRYGIPADGKNKDSLARIHVDLLPYENLTEAEKEKDRMNIKVLMQL